MGFIHPLRRDLQAILKETIEHFNANFQKVGKMDDQLVHNFNILAKVVNGIEGQEQLFKDVLLELETGMQLLDQRMSFMVLKLQHFTALSTILHTSHFHENIILLERALFKNNICSFASCETRIFSTREGPIITIHRELLSLRPSQQVLLTCQATSRTHVQAYHNQIGRQPDKNTVLLDTNIIQIGDLRNKSVMEEKLRFLLESEKQLEVFHIFNKNHLQCLERVNFILNGAATTCNKTSPKFQTRIWGRCAY